MTSEKVMMEWEKSWSDFRGHRMLGNFFLNGARDITLEILGEIEGVHSEDI